jgi:ABC-type branched-subunit amino acid transport system permease subunit
MSGGDDPSPVPQAPPDGTAAPQIGVDEWVASHEGRLQLGRLQRELARVPRPGFYLAFGIAAAILPAVTSDQYIVRVGFDTLLYMLLALGLNIVVGYAGLLDLGYVAFYGFGAYGYAMLASPKFGLHWSTLAVVPIVVLATAMLGLLVALPSRRLVGDYLAIVTLFFGQLFVTVYQNGQAMSVLGFTRQYDVTGGPNGIPGVDPFHAFGATISSLDGYYYAALIVFLIALAAVSLVDASRTGRAWRSLREDSLAAELMGMPVNLLKLLAFAFGAAIAGLAGTLFAALNTAVFAPDFDTPTLIIIYSMLILGGAGSLGGVILGALVVNVSLEVLRTPGHATWVFFGLLAVSLLAKLRPWRWLAGVVAGTVALGFAVHAIASAWWPRGVNGVPQVGGALGSGLQHWVLLPVNPQLIGNVSFVILVLVVLWVTTLQGWMQKVALVPTLYLSAFVWENRLVAEPSITRLIFVGVILIVLMNARPQGLLGSARVEIV